MFAILVSLPFSALYLVSPLDPNEVIADSNLTAQSTKGTLLALPVALYNLVLDQP